MLISSIDYRPTIKTYEVDIIELNHHYDKDTTTLNLNQLIFWRFALDNVRKYGKQRVAVDWRRLPTEEYNETLTEEEYRQKNKEFQDEWAKKHGNNIKAPDYNLKFIGGIRCPRYDYKLKKWYVILYEKDIFKIIYSTSYFESWSTVDPEVENQQIYSREYRQGLK